MKKSFSQQVAEFTIKRRGSLLLFTVILSLILGSGILRTRFDTSFTALLTQGDPYLEEFDLLEEEFPSAIEISFAFTPEQGKTVFDKTVLDAISQLKDNYKAIPYAERLSSLIDYYSPETRKRLFTRSVESYSQTELNALLEGALADRLLTANLLSQDAALVFALITTTADQDSAQQRLQVAQGVLQLRDALRAQNPHVGIHVNSEVLLEQSSQQAMLDDLTRLMPLVILACVLVICYCFRSVTLGICILSHTLFTMLSTVGALAYLGLAFNSISVMAPLIVVIIAVANSVHIISIYKQSLHRGNTNIVAMQESVAQNFQPITLAAVTTAIGFSSLNMCSSPAIQDFGQIVAVGIVFAYLFTLTLLPALLIKFSALAKKSDPADSPFMHKALHALSEFTARNDKSIFYSCSALAVITAMLLPLNETDFNRIDFIATDSDIRQYYDEISLHLNRGPALSYGIETNVVDGTLDPQFLSRVEQFSQWLAQQRDIESVASIVDVVKTIHQNQNKDNAEYFRIPDDQNTIANYLLGYVLVQSKDFPLFGFVSTDFSLLRLFINATPTSNQQLLDLDQRISARFKQDFPEAALLHGSGLLLFARMDALVTVELLQGYSLSLLLITLSLIVGLRSVYFGILSVLPNLLPATIVFGLWAVFVGQLDPFVMMLFSISIGLVVDDTVHILSHYLRQRQAGVDKSLCIEHAIKVAGPALTITTLVLALGTTILIWANTLYFQQAAKLLVPIVLIALALDLLYLPTVLRRFDNRFDKRFDKRFKAETP